MAKKQALIITTISSPNKILKNYALECNTRGYQFIVIGDEASPADFQIDGCDYYSIKDQLLLDFRLAKLCPQKHYARKNLGYLIAMSKGVDIILETDDDNIPYDSFWSPRSMRQYVPKLDKKGWVNIYRYFSDNIIWPRGLPLSYINNSLPDFDLLGQIDIDCPIQQGLANDNPDVDAIYRLILPLPQSFKTNRSLALTDGCWCPFNSQNTLWFAVVFPLLYLPSYCSFRMTDIWRSFIAQRIIHENGWGLLFYEPTVRQERNEHDLHRDFCDEVPGYKHNNEIQEQLASLSLKPGIEYISQNLRICYEKLVSISLLPEKELELVDAWIYDLERMKSALSN